MTDWTDEQMADKLVRLNIVHGNLEELGPELHRNFLMHLGARAIEKDPEYYFRLVDLMKADKDGSSEQTLPSDSS